MPVSRRTFLSFGAGAIAARAQKPDGSLTVLLDEQIGKISPFIYGQFAEHVGGLIYDGIWVGRDSRIPNQQGYRTGTLQALQKVRPGIIRWPGGCFADAYHWQDGVGSQRVFRRNHWWDRDEPNTFGTDEFLGWCSLLGAQPYLSVNVGSGSVSEALDWLDYCNGAGASSYAKMRVRNGHAQPYGVKWWGIGNENWGCGGLFTAGEYAQRFREYAMYFKRFGLSDQYELVGVGHTPEWNRDFLNAAGQGLPYLNHLSIHRYFRTPATANFTDEDYGKLINEIGAFEREIRTALAAIRDAEPLRNKIRVFGPLKPRPIGLVIDEWGIWDADSTLASGFRQHGALRDALFAGACLNLFHRYCDRISMTSVAQVVNVLQALILTEGASSILTPTYHVYRMYQPHQNATCVRTEAPDGPLSVSASRSSDRLLLTVVNQSLTQDADLEVIIRGGKVMQAEAANLTADNVRSQNTREQPDTVSPRPAGVRNESSKLLLQAPAKSVQAVSVKLM